MGKMGNNSIVGVIALILVFAVIGLGAIACVVLLRKLKRKFGEFFISHPIIATLLIALFPYVCFRLLFWSGWSYLTGLVALVNALTIILLGFWLAFVILFILKKGKDETEEDSIKTERHHRDITLTTTFTLWKGIIESWLRQNSLAEEIGLTIREIESLDDEFLDFFDVTTSFELLRTLDDFEKSSPIGRHKYLTGLERYKQLTGLEPQRYKNLILTTVKEAIDNMELYQINLAEYLATVEETQNEE